jgi:hypothetical protein
MSASQRKELHDHIGTKTCLANLLRSQELKKLLNVIYLSN